MFSYGFLVYAAILLAVVLHWFLTRTRAGLNLRAVGENPATADAAGINVTLYKYLSTCIGAGICGIGGLYYVLDYNQASGRPPARSRRWAGWPWRWSFSRPGSR